MRRLIHLAALAAYVLALALGQAPSASAQNINLPHRIALTAAGNVRPYLGVIGNRNNFANFNTAGTAIMARTGFDVLEDVVDIGVAIANFEKNTTGGATEAGNGGVLSAHVGIECTGDAIFDLTWPAALQGADAVHGNIASGAIGRTDLHAWTKPSGSHCWVRQYDTNPSGTYYLSDGRDTAGGDLLTFVPGSDVVLGGTITQSGSFPTRWLPVAAIFGHTKHGTFCIAGDSLNQGLNDAFDIYNRRGLIGHSMPTTQQWLNLSLSGVKASNYLTSAAGELAGLKDLCQMVSIPLGTNDFTTDSAATMEANIQAIRATFPGSAKFFTETLPPVSTDTTDGWATLGGQTATTGGGTRANLNTDIRAGLPGFSGYWDMAAVLESGSTGKWIVGQVKTVTDGAMSSTVNPTFLTSATANFNTATDAGLAVWVPGAGAAGATLKTVIVSVTNSTTAVLNVAASTTVSGATVTYDMYTDDGKHCRGVPCFVAATTAFHPTDLTYP